MECLKTPEWRGWHTFLCILLLHHSCLIILFPVAAHYQELNTTEVGLYLTGTYCFICSLPTEGGRHVHLLLGKQETTKNVTVCCLGHCWAVSSPLFTERKDHAAARGVLLSCTECTTSYLLQPLHPQFNFPLWVNVLNRLLRLYYLKFIRGARCGDYSGVVNYCAIFTFIPDYSLCSWLWALLHCMYSAGLNFPSPPFI